jgi:hypothetical protein
MILVVVGMTGWTHLGKGKGIMANDVQKGSGKRFGRNGVQKILAKGSGKTVFKRFWQKVQAKRCS